MIRQPMRLNISSMTVCVVILAFAAPAALAQASASAQNTGPNSGSNSGSNTGPKTSWGAPDLQGVWTNSSITRLTRPSGVDRLVLTPEEARSIEDKDYNNVRTEAEKAPTDQSTGAPEKGKPLPGVGNYNAVWVDPGSRMGKVKGEFRSSWIVEPASGEIPMSEAGRRKMAAWRPRATAARGGAGGAYEGPESRSTGERCLIGFGGTGGPVMLNVLYNNHYQIVQSPDHVVIVVEMNHDARIIPLTRTRTRPTAIQPWLGDSIGWYEGDTLVVETRNVNRQQTGPVFISDTGRLTERFTRQGETEILYEFSVEDAEVYTQPWRGEMTLTGTDDEVYEYACHEGNYGLYGILAGARVQEREGKSLAVTPDSE